MNEPTATEMFGLRFSPLTLPDAITAIHMLAHARRRRFVLPVNVDVALRFLRSAPTAPFREACRRADLILADGMPIVWSSRLLGKPLPGRVTGVDLTVAICTAAGERRETVYLLGAAPGVAQRAARRLKALSPTLEVAGTHAPPQGFDQDAAASRGAVRAVNQVRPDYLFVALGMPKQELWIHAHLDDLDVGTVIAVGGSFDIIAGDVPRAPGWMRAAGLEWLWRLSHEPRRLWYRYLITNPAFFYHVWREWRS